jgi:hypothetical protein
MVTRVSGCFSYEREVTFPSTFLDSCSDVSKVGRNLQVKKLVMAGHGAEMPDFNTSHGAVSHWKANAAKRSSNWVPVERRGLGDSIRCRDGEKRERKEKNGRLAYSTLPCRGTLKVSGEKLQVGEVEVV